MRVAVGEIAGGDLLAKDPIEAIDTFPAPPVAAFVGHAREVRAGCQVRAEADVVDAGTFDDVVEMAHIVFERRLPAGILVPAHRPVDAGANDAALFGDQPDDVVGFVALQVGERAGVGMGDQDRLLGSLDDVQHRALADVAQIDGDTDVVHDAHRIAAEQREARLLGLEAAVAELVAVVVGELHNAQAEAPEKVQAVQVVGNGAGVLPTHDETDLAGGPRAVEVGRRFDLMPGGIRCGKNTVPAGDLGAGFRKVGFEVAGGDVQRIDAAGAQVRHVAVAVIDEAIDDVGVAVQGCSIGHSTLPSTGGADLASSTCGARDSAGLARATLLRWLLLPGWSYISGRAHFRPLQERSMKAAVLYEPNTPLVIEDIATRKPGAHEVLLNTAYAGLCHSDLHFIEGLYPHPLPVVLGHESAGIVEQVGSEVTYVKPGDHVITCLSVFCGTCEQCTSGRTVICTNTDVKMLPGQSERLEWDKSERLHQFINMSSFAEQMLVHENAIVKIREDMPLDRAALIGCGVMTGFGAVVNTASVRFGETVAVIGCGGVGMAAINGAHVAGAGRIIAVDTNPVKLQLATKLGATDLVNPNDADPVEQVKGLTKGGVDHAIECLGLKRTAEQSFEMLRVGGTATIVGMVPFGEKIELHGFDFLRERKIQGSSMGSNRFRTDMPRLIELYLQGRLHLDDWISDKIKLEDINDGFTAMKEGRAIRSLIDFGVAA